MAGKLIDRWLKRKAPDDVSNQGPVSNVNTSHEPINKKPMFVFQLQRKSIGRRRSNLIQAKGKIYVLIILIFEI